MLDYGITCYIYIRPATGERFWKHSTTSYLGAERNVFHRHLYGTMISLFIVDGDRLCCRECTINVA
jgi:hypothetical protein